MYVSTSTTVNATRTIVDDDDECRASREGTHSLRLSIACLPVQLMTRHPPRLASPPALRLAASDIGLLTRRTPVPPPELM